jgi:FAD/FMN-containing dehydrogenase
VLTNYLGLTVGGTLSTGGIGVTTFRRGTQADQATRLQVVTGRGEVLACSATEHRDLFEAALVGQGRCGVIVRAVLRAERLPRAVREYVLPYRDLACLMQAGQRVRDDRRFDGVVATIVPALRRWTYLLAGTRYFTPPAAPDDAELLADLDFIAGGERIRSVDYLEYADTGPPLDHARSHVDLGLCIPQSAAAKFIEDMLRRLTARDLGTAAALRVFFLNRAPFTRPLLRIPQEDAFDYVALLRTETDDSHALGRMLAGNRSLFESCRDAGGTLYPFAAVRMSADDWVQHYGPCLRALRHARRRYDPDRVFAAGWELPP